MLEHVGRKRTDMFSMLDEKGQVLLMLDERQD